MKRSYIIIWDKDKQRYIFGVLLQDKVDNIQARFYDGKRDITDEYHVVLIGKYLKSRPNLDKEFRTIDRVFKYSQRLAIIEMLEEAESDCRYKLQSSRYGDDENQKRINDNVKHNKNQKKLKPLSKKQRLKLKKNKEDKKNWDDIMK